MTREDTIAAIATPQGAGGIGIIRISGDKAEAVASKLFRPSIPVEEFTTHRLYHGDIVAPDSDTVLDDVLIALMKSPSSYTGEDTLEIYCHGGHFILQSVLKEILKMGCRPAMPGEFTKRAFLNNRLDLSQAEAVSDMIAAKSERGLELAVSQLKGNLSEKIEGLRGRIITVLADLESVIDLAADDVSGTIDGAAGGPLSVISDIVQDMEEMIATYEQGRCLRDGINVVISGRPNVGKSSLLNALLGEKRAIVTSIPGTTRDFIEEYIDIDGVAVKLTDTAGIREPKDIIEQEGIALTWERLSLADLTVIMLDGSEELSGDDRRIIAGNTNKKTLVAINKCDLPSRLDIADVEALLPGKDILRISAKYGDGLQKIKTAIRNTALGTDSLKRTKAIIADLRHKTALEKAVSFLLQARKGIQDNISPELIAVDLNDALASIGEITGKTTAEDILASIFSRFCVGK